MRHIDQEEKGSGAVSSALPREAQTMVMTRSKEKVIGPRLVCTTISGESTICPLDKTKLVIGRSVEADLNLLDPLVSRKHCVIEDRQDGFFLRNVSTTNPLLLNDKPIAEERLYAGDQIRIGSTTMAFISDRARDEKRLNAKPLSQNKQSGWGLWVTVAVLTILVGYFGYFQVFTPLKVKWALSAVSKQIQMGRYRSAQNSLKHLLELDLSPEHRSRVKGLLTESTLAITQQMARDEDLNTVILYLKKYLAQYGAGKESAVLWERLDYYRLTLAHGLESTKNFQPALRQYAAIKEDSIYFEEAHKAIRRIWIAHQQKPRKNQTLAQLLKEADTHFRAQRYLKPMNQNAYLLYQAALTLEPGNELALKRINQMKSFYREHGNKHFADKNWSRALSYFERYYLIDTESKDINDKMIMCRQKLAKTRTSDEKAGSAEIPSANRVGEKQKSSSEQAEKKEKIKRLLEESGTESSWIMQYLFEDQQKETDAEKPW
ncbi:MAG: FHA domain-containing protein [Desulfobacterales bacterium]|jgi:pSer/pThr/pTyr-binding forkhead associated (FHA) protein